LSYFLKNMFNIYKLPLWNEITLELDDIDKIKKAQLISLNPKLFLLMQKDPGLSQIFLFHSSFLLNFHLIYSEC